MKKLCAILTLAMIVSACGSDPETIEPATDAPLTKEEAAVQAQRADELRDFCDMYDWYDDGICDEFCASPDPDCDACPEVAPPAPDFCPDGRTIPVIRLGCTRRYTCFVDCPELSPPDPAFCPDGSIEPVEDGACTVGYECVTDECPQIHPPHPQFCDADEELTTVEEDGCVIGFTCE